MVFGQGNVRTLKDFSSKKPKEKICQFPYTKCEGSLQIYFQPKPQEKTPGKNHIRFIQWKGKCSLSNCDYFISPGDETVSKPCVQNLYSIDTPSSSEENLVEVEQEQQEHGK